MIREEVTSKMHGKAQEWALANKHQNPVAHAYMEICGRLDSGGYCDPEYSEDELVSIKNGIASAINMALD